MSKYLLCCALLISGMLHAQKLVVGIVVDQMSNEYLNRFSARFGENGFRQLIKDGFYAENTRYNYVPTYTGPGHASVYTGTTPAMHGIAANDWYDRQTGAGVYCVADKSVTSVGVEAESGRRSPAMLFGATITDMLKLSTYGESKVIGIALKDRSAILPVGRSADAAYWWDESGQWISSDYYRSALPAWVTEFGKAHPASSYLQTWTSSANVTHKAFYETHNQYEAPFTDGGSTAFPYDLKSLSEKRGLRILKETPFGDQYTLDFAKAAVKGEVMGKDDVTDFLAVSFSSTDYVGHRFGPYSEEIEDAYLRFDKLLADFLQFLDAEVGSGNYIVFLTADHGVMPNATFLQSRGINAARVNYAEMESGINQMLQSVYGGEKMVAAVMGEQIYLDPAKLALAKAREEEVERRVADYLMAQPYIQVAVSAHDLEHKAYADFPIREIQQGYHKDRSGDVHFVLKPFFDDDEHAQGAGHGKPYTFDTHVPLIFYGPGRIKAGRTISVTDITQVVPTLADLLRIPRPPYAVDESLIEFIK